MAKENETPTEYLKRLFGLDPGDLSLEAGFTKEDVDWCAEKYNLTTADQMDLGQAKRVLSRFGYEG